MLPAVVQHYTKIISVFTISIALLRILFIFCTQSIILVYTLACVRLSNLCIESSHTKFRYPCFCKPALYLSPFCSVNSFIKILSADASCNCDISFCAQLIIELFYNLICIRFRYIQFLCNLIGSDKRLCRCNQCG